jgi:glutamate N-acetyltransferase / amino-acid N-acetyltransferase
MTPQGFKSLGTYIGIKEKNKDFALIVSDVEASAAAVFTRSTFCGAPVTLGKELIKAGRAQAFLITSGISNVATGQAGLDNARREMEAMGAELGIDPNLVLPNSTGVIGVQLPMGKILKAISGCKDALGTDNWEATSEAIMTTDTHHAFLLGDRCGNSEQRFATIAKTRGGQIIQLPEYRFGYQHERYSCHNGKWFGWKC